MQAKCTITPKIRAEPMEGCHHMIFKKPWVLIVHVKRDSFFQTVY
jgi:hypothetical protein